MEIPSIVVSGTGDDWHIRLTCETCGSRVTVVWEQLVEGLVPTCAGGHLQPADGAAVLEVPHDWD